MIVFYKKLIIVSIEILKELKIKDNFPPEVWENKGLIMSPQEVCLRLNNDYNLMLDEAIEQLSKNNSKQKLVRQLGKKLRSISKNQYDTEERELFLDKVIDLGKILKIDLRFEANRWLCGYILAKLFTR